MPSSTMSSASRRMRRPSPTNDTHHLAAHEQVALAATGRDAQVGVARLARPVDDMQPITATCNGMLRASSACAPRHADDVDLGASARRACDQVEPLALAQAHRLEQLTPRFGLLDRVGGEGEPDGVPDPLGEQRGDPRGRLHEPAGQRTRFGDAEMQRVVDGLSRAAGRRRS